MLLGPLLGLLMGLLLGLPLGLLLGLMLKLLLGLLGCTTHVPVMCQGRFCDTVTKLALNLVIKECRVTMSWKWWGQHFSLRRVWVMRSFLPRSAPR